MPAESSTPTISLSERSGLSDSQRDKLPKWLFLSLLFHGLLIASLFILPFLPSRRDYTPPVYTVDLVGGEKIGGNKIGTELQPQPAPKEVAKNRTESAQKSSKGEVISTGPGEGEGAAALGPGGRGGGVVKGMDFIIYQNRMFDTIKQNWAWIGQRSDVKVIVRFGIKENGEIVGLKVVQPSGDWSYDESVLRAVKKSSPLPPPPEPYRKDFADVQVTFRP